MLSLRNLRSYLKLHPHYFAVLLVEICRVCWWRIKRQPIVVLTTESGGLGDYLWFRSYYSAIRDHYSPIQCRIIVVGMRQWEPLALGMDKDAKSNHFDIYRSFESPDNPLKIESLFFKLFKADVYVNFRARHLKQLVRAKEHYFGKGFRETKQYYETANNAVINQWFVLPDEFIHRPPLLPIDNSRKKILDKPYVVFVEGGNTQGRLSEEQTITIVKHIISKGFNIFFNGDYKRLVSVINPQQTPTSRQIIDGYTFPLTEYPSVVTNCQYVVTVNTFVYHLAIQLRKPCIVISANEYESVKLDAPNQVVLFNDKLHIAYENNALNSYHRIASVNLSDIRCDRIAEALNTIHNKC